MAADLGFIVHAAKRKAHELASQRPRDGLAERGLAHAGRSDEAENRTLHVRLQSTHREVIEDAILYFFQVIVIGVEDLFGFEDLDFLPGSLGPGQHGEPLDVVARERIVGGHGRHAREAAQFLERFFLDFVGHAGVVDLLFQIIDVARTLVLLTQFLLDGLHLLAQVILALRLLDAVLHFALNLIAKLLHFKFFGEMLVDFFEPHPDVEGLERVLLVGRRERRQRGGDEIDQTSGFVDVHGHGGKLVGKSGRTGDNLLKEREHVALQRFNFRAVGRNRFRNRRHASAHKGRKLRKLAEAYPLQTLSEHKETLVGHLDDFVDDGRGTDGVEIGGLRAVDAGLALRHHDDGLIFSQRIDQLDGTLPAYG